MQKQYLSNNFKSQKNWNIFKTNFQHGEVTKSGLCLTDPCFCKTYWKSIHFPISPPLAKCYHSWKAATATMWWIWPTNHIPKCLTHNRAYEIHFCRCLGPSTHCCILSIVHPCEMQTLIEKYKLLHTEYCILYWVSRVTAQNSTEEKCSWSW